MNRLASFAPVADERARILVLGSMPGEKSLAENQYYAHPRNAFWQIMGELFQFDECAPYADRLQQLSENRIALWDVLASCQRSGSLDSSIVATTELPNDFPAFLAHHKNIEHIVFNGKKAQQSFHRLVSAELVGQRRVFAEHLLPSTSPANAMLRPGEKLVLWREAFELMGCL